MLRRLAAALLISAAPALAACGSSDAGADDAFADPTPDTLESPGVASARDSAAGSGAPPHLRPGEVAWRPVGRWTGDGTKTTEAFEVRAREWRLILGVVKGNEQGVYWLTARVHRASNDSLVSTASKNRLGMDTSYVHAGPGLFYLDVQPGNALWEVMVEEREIPAERIAP